MSIIIQAGHESSSSEILMESLYSQGLKAPVPSNIQQLSGKEISDTLDKVINKKQKSNSNKLVENIVADFLLANINQDDWGWADSKNLIALPYWQAFEPNTQFFLVFDHPKKILSHSIESKLTTGDIDDLMKEWLLYHSNMLNFLEAHSNKCLLLEGAFCINNMAQTKDLFRGLSSSSLVFKSDEQADTILIKDSDFIESSNNSTHEIIFEEIIKNYPEVVNVFNLLLSKADFKGSKVIYKTKRPDFGTLVAAVTDISSSKVDFDNKNNIINDLQVKLKAAETLQIENDILITSLSKSQEVIKKLSKEKSDIENNASNFELIGKKNEELASDNNALIGTLHTLQESMEKMVDDNANIQSDFKKLVVTNEMLAKENSVLIRELHNTQNLLEKKHASLQLPSTDVIERPKTDMTTSGAVAIYHTPESRIKNDFPYRLGAALVKTKTMKDMVSLPLTVAKEYRDYLQIKEELESLPLLDKEADVLQAEKVKAHLSYRVGNTVMQSLKSPKKIVKLPVNIGKDLLDFKK